jgi:hypothetical protein
MPRDDVPEEAGFTPPLFSNEQVHAMAEFVETHGRSRARAQGSDFSEFDYLAGAMSMFFALKLQNRMPARWVFDAFTGRSPLDIEVPDRQVYVVMEGKLRQARAIYKNRHVAQEHVEQLWREGDDAAFVATERARSALESRVQARIDAYYQREEDAG